MAELSIFISHRYEDRALARALRGHLQFLGSKGQNLTITCFVCEEIPGGTEWRDWIIDKTQQADCLIFLHTSSDHNWMWCAAEIAQYDGYKRALAKPSRIAWFSVEESPSFAMLSSKQFYRTDIDDVSRFFRELFETKGFSDTILIRDLHIGHSNDFNAAVHDISGQFSGITRPEELFRRRLRIALAEETAFKTVIAGSAQLKPVERAEALLQNAIYEADPATKEFLVGGDELSWSNLVAAQEGQTGAWLEELKLYIASSFPDATPAERKSREQVLSALFTDRRLHQPVIARLDYVDRQPFSIVIIFVPLPPFSEDPQLMLSQRVPREVVFLALLHRLARRFRWGVLEPLYSLVEGGVDPPSDARWKDVVAQYTRGIRDLNSLEQHANIEEFKTVSRVVDATGLPNAKLLEQMSADYAHFKSKLEDAIQAKSFEAVRQVLTPWLAKNKELMLEILDEHKKHVEKLRPKANGG